MPLEVTVSAAKGISSQMMFVSVSPDTLLPMIPSGTTAWKAMAEIELMLQNSP